MKADDTTACRYGSIYHLMDPTRYHLLGNVAAEAKRAIAQIHPLPQLVLYLAMTLLTDIPALITSYLNYWYYIVFYMGLPLKTTGSEYSCITIPSVQAALVAGMLLNIFSQVGGDNL